MATLTSGDTLSLNSLGSATGQGASNISLGTIKGSPVGGDDIGLSTFGIDSVGSISGYTYVVESTSENYTLGFSGAGSNFSKISSTSSNFTWSVSGGSTITLSTNNGATATFAAGDMNPQSPGSQTTLQSQITHTLGVTFSDGFNDHIGTGQGYNVQKTKTVYSVDTYDGNTALCLTSDSPVTKADGSVVEVGELEEGDLLKGYSILGLGVDSDSNFLEWNTSDLSITEKDVKVVNVVYSFTQRYYSINNGEITATSEHPLLIKDSETNEYKFKEVLGLKVGDSLIKGNGSGFEEVEITSIDTVNETTEIVSIDVEEEDTYMVNGYITHNKGGDSHSDLSAPSAPTSFTYSSPSLSWVAPSSSGDTGITGYDFQIDDNSDYSSPIADVSEWSTTSAEVVVGWGLTPGNTYYARVRAIDHGLKSAWATLTFTA